MGWITEKRLTIMVGHYGSGKTELAVNLALMLAGRKKRVALADLDVVNPYFRSREKGALLEEKGNLGLVAVQFKSLRRRRRSFHACGAEHPDSGRECYVGLGCGRRYGRSESAGQISASVGKTGLPYVICPERESSSDSLSGDCKKLFFGKSKR